MQKIEKGKLISKNLELNGEIFLDGGHNKSAGVALSKWIKNFENVRFYIILGMMNNKDIEGFLKPIKGASPMLTTLFLLADI